jgi:tetratricopeptide (TPR) repeat protein
VTYAAGVAAALALLMIAGCSTAPRTPTPIPRATKAPRALILYAIMDREVRLAHLGQSYGATAAGSAVSAGRPIGDIEPLPAVVSDRHQAALVDAEKAYASQNYVAALAVLEPAYRDEPTNPFVLEAYGRALYRQRERERAFTVYRELVDQLDAEWATDDPRVVTIDLWFVDAYWKVGTLHMDREEWQRAAFEISRALAGGFMWERLAVDQALSYLTKAYAELDRRDIARYYAERALERNPRNAFVKRYLDPLSRDSKPTDDKQSDSKP